MFSNFRKWWRPPAMLADREQERSVTFLELFYDLVYVVVIAEIAHHLALHVDLQGLLESTFLFVLVWIAWVNGTLYHELHGQHDVRTRVFTFLQMLTVAGMAVFAHSAFGSGATGFALCFAAYQLILTNLWWQTGVYDPGHRPLSRPYSLSFLLSAMLFVLSVFVPQTERVVLWVTALALTVSLPALLSTLARGDPDVQRQHEQAMTMTHAAVERFGLFTIIVLGEVIVGVVQGVAGHHHLDWNVGGTAALGMLVAIGLWWLYFDFVSMRLPKPGSRMTFTWMYLHLTMTMGMVAAGAAMLNVVESAGHALADAPRWLMVGSIALVLASVTGLMATLRTPDELRPWYRRGKIVTLVSAALVVATGFSNLATIPLLALVIGLMLMPIVYGVQVWVRVFGGERLER